MREPFTEVCAREVTSLPVVDTDRGFEAGGARVGLVQGGGEVGSFTDGDLLAAAAVAALPVEALAAGAGVGALGGVAAAADGVGAAVELAVAFSRLFSAPMPLRNAATGAIATVNTTAPVITSLGLKGSSAPSTTGRWRS